MSAAAPRTPFGFWLVGALSACFAAVMVVVLLALDANPDPDTVFFRGAAGLLAVLAGVVTEALWRVRPWVRSASVLLALAYAGVVALTMLGEPGGRVGDVVAVLAVSGVVVVPLLLYIFECANEIWPPRHPRHPFNTVRVPRLSPRKSPWQRGGP